MLFDHPSDGPTAIRTQFGAIFVSLELSRSNWLTTSLSPGRGEKMSRHSVVAGDVAGLMTLFADLRRKTAARTGQSYPITTIQEAGLDGFRLHRVLQQELWTVSAKGDPHRPSQILATRNQTLAEVQHAAKHEVEPSVIVRSLQAPRSMWCYSLPHLGCLSDSDGVQHANGGDRAIKASGFDGQPANKCRAHHRTSRWH